MNEPKLSQPLILGYSVEYIPGEGWTLGMEPSPTTGV